MQNKSRWVEHNHERRKRGEQELSFEHFMASRNSGPMASWRECRQDAASLHMRLAGQRYLDGKNFAAAWHSGIAAVFNPGNIFSRLKRIVTFRRKP